MKQKIFKNALKNPSALDSKHLDAIYKYFADLAQVDEKLGQALVTYIVDGTGDEVLLTLAGRKDIVAKLGYDASGDIDWDLIEKIEKDRLTMLNGCWNAPPEVWIRMGHVLEAAQRADGIAPNTLLQPAWLAVLLEEVARIPYELDREKGIRWTGSQTEKVLVAGEVSADFLVDLVLNGERYQSICCNSFSEMAEYFTRHITAVEKVLAANESDRKVLALTILIECQFDFKTVIPLLGTMLLSSSKTVREAAYSAAMSSEALLSLCVPLIETRLSEGNASERNEAVQLLWRLKGRDCKDLFTKHLLTEKADRVKQTIEKLLAIPDDDQSIGKDTLPALHVEHGYFPLTEEMKSKMHEHFSKSFERAETEHKEEVEEWNKPDRPSWLDKPVPPIPLKEEVFEKIVAFVEGSTTEFDMKLIEEVNEYCRTSPNNWCYPPQGKLVQYVRWSHVTGLLELNMTEKEIWWNQDGELAEFKQAHNGPLELRELDAIVATLPEYEPGMVAKWYLGRHREWSECNWDADEVWPAFAEHPELLQEALIPAKAGSYHGSTMRDNAFHVLSTFPKCPPKFIHLLWDLALSESKGDRLPAQQALASVPGKAEKIAVALEDGKQSIRVAAAEWLGRLKDREAIPALKKAFIKEKNELAKGVMLHALDRLKADLDEFLNKDKLLAEAKAGVAKKIPKGMEWVPLDSLPKLHWAESNEQVDPTIVRWWVVQSIQQKTPVGGPILRHYLSMCKRTEATVLARMLLSTWIAYDTATLPPEDAAAKAKEEVEQNWVDSDVEYFGSKDNYYKTCYQRHASETLHSGIDQKGMLAIASVVGDRDCVKMCEQYMREWFGNRLAQCKCLIEVLDGIDDPSALQVLLSIANRFRTKALKQAAEERVHAIAEREGWTLDELADRTMPDAGFERPLDENGEPTGSKAVLELDYGARQFTVELNDNLEPVICVKGENKPLKNPPAPAKNDDEEKASEAKKAFTDAKKVVKDVVKRQKERLYEALCTQRFWKFSDWQTYLACHPIVGRLCVKLVWVAFTPVQVEEDAPSLPGDFITCFRPIEDGSLTNENDESVELPPEALVVLAHTCNVPAGIEQAWMTHLQDYDVEPIFPQFGRKKYALPEEKKAETAINDFTGFGITTFKLRSKANKLGYSRGEVEDGGTFCSYHKTFGSLKIEATIEFTGSYVPEEDLPAALTTLQFCAIPEERQRRSRTIVMPLSKVPAVLLSECYNDMQQIAAEGTGFDQEWQKKSFF